MTPNDYMIQAPPMPEHVPTLHHETAAASAHEIAYMVCACGWHSPHFVAPRVMVIAHGHAELDAKAWASTWEHVARSYRNIAEAAYCVWAIETAIDKASSEGKSQDFLGQLRERRGFALLDLRRAVEDDRYGRGRT